MTRSPDILQSFVDHKLGVEFEQVRTSADILAEYDWMPETRWGAWPVGGSKPGMCVGATSEEALRKLREKFPHIGRIAA